MANTAPYLINTGHVDLPESFLIPLCTTRERYDMIISALMVGGEVVYGEEEILHLVDFLNALPLVREDCNVDYDDLVTAIEAAQNTADNALSVALAALPIANLPDNAFLIPDMARTVSAGFTAPTMQASQHIAQYSQMRGLNSEVEFKILLQSGSYVATLTYIKASTGGQIRVQIDGANIWNTIETYNATTLLAQHISANLPAAISAGLHTINIKIPSKNASSSNYDLLMSYLTIRKQ